MTDEQTTNKAKDSQTDPAAARLMKMATYGAVTVASSLVLFKFGAWIATESLSLLSTLIDSLLDVGASLINLYAVHHALQPADKEHRFGHGKAEPLAGLAQAAFISGSALFILFEAGDRLLHPRDVVNIDAGLGVMGVSIVFTLLLIGFQRYVVKKTGSVAIQADSMHYKMDVLVNLGVIVSLVLVSRFGWLFVDPLIAVAIALYIFRGAWEIGTKSLDLLMDHELPENERKRIEEIALGHPGVLGLHDMRTRSSGMNLFIQFHLDMNGDISLKEAHVIAEAVMYKIEDAFPNAEVLIHEDPAGIDERRLDFS
ncbi:MAG TPA: cation diffusion facilitator family transporter [Rhodospirillales bacterium]|nr:cation diffusion facilitator family transporter [Rhodospirillales bacterium]